MNTHTPKPYSANKRLFKAAPDLLEALERFTDYMELTHYAAKDSMLAINIMHAKAAIAKARQS